MAAGAVSKALAGKVSKAAKEPIAAPPRTARRTTPIPGTLSERVHLALDVFETQPIPVISGILGVKALQSIGALTPSEAYTANLLTAVGSTGANGPFGVGIVALATAIPAAASALRNGIDGVIPSLPDYRETLLERNLGIRAARSGAQLVRTAGQRIDSLGDVYRDRNIIGRILNRIFS